MKCWVSGELSLESGSGSWKGNLCVEASSPVSQRILVENFIRKYVIKKRCPNSVNMGRKPARPRVSRCFRRIRRENRKFRSQDLCLLPDWVLKQIWEKYCKGGKLFISHEVEECPLKEPADLLVLFMYIVRYPVYRFVPWCLGVSQYHLHYTIKPGIEFLSQHMHEIFWSDRLSLWNHCHDFPYYVTIQVDTFPVG